jgi:hypothetical protein
LALELSLSCLTINYSLKEIMYFGGHSEVRIFTLPGSN